MLPVNCGSHTDYQNFATTNLQEWKTDDYEAIIHLAKPVKITLTFYNVMQFLGEQGADPETHFLVIIECIITSLQDIQLSLT